MSKLTVRFVTLALCVAGLWTSCDEAAQNDINSKGLHQMQVKKGEILVFSLPQNKSTGYELCWMNESKLNRQFKLQGVKSMLKDPNNVDGGGETLTYQVLATETGSDTLKFNNCPTRLWQKDCDFFAVDSVREQENGQIVSTYAPNSSAEYRIVVTVTE